MCVSKEQNKKNNIQKSFSIVNTPNPDDLIFAFHDEHIYLLDGKIIPDWKSCSQYFNLTRNFYCFSEDKENNKQFLLFDADYLESNSEFIKIPLRKAWEFLSDTLFSIARYARHLYHWRKTHAYCGVCSTKNSNKKDEQAFICDACGHVTYPRIAPCIILLIYHENKLLLARSPHFPKSIYSTIAGFVDPGESLEEAIHREVFEELGVRVKNIAYFGSQPWPFPDSLMIGFTAEYLSGDINIDPTEIEDAQWFDIKKLPELPSKISISRELIEAYLSRI